MSKVYLLLVLLLTTKLYAISDLESFQYKHKHTPICNIDISKKINLKGVSFIDFYNLKNKIKGIDIFNIKNKDTRFQSKKPRRQTILFSDSSLIKEINYITGEAVTINGDKVYFDLQNCYPKNEDVENYYLIEGYKTFLSQKEDVDLWVYYEIAHNLLDIAEKHNSFYVKADKLTPFELYEMHPYKTRNLTEKEKEEIKILISEFENQIPKIYYLYTNKDIEKKMIFNEIITKYNDFYKKLK